MADVDLELPYDEWKVKYLRARNEAERLVSQTASLMATLTELYQNPIADTTNKGRVIGVRDKLNADLSAALANP